MSDREISAGAAILALGMLWGTALLSAAAGVFRVWRYEEEYDCPTRRQHRYTGRTQIRTKEGWRNE